MGAYLDVIFSIVLGSMLLLMILGYNFDLVDTNHYNSMYMNVQNTGITFKEIFKNDIKKIGLGVPDTTNVFVIADSNEIKFRVDLNLDSSINEIHYYLGDLSSTSFTSNPNDKILYRKVDNNPPETFSIGLTNLNFTYFNDQGSQTATLADIKHVAYSVYLESTFDYNGEYPGIFIRGRMKPRNLMSE